MNKLDVALKLFRLLNERKVLDSRLVADELEVSIRTAQRYLLELSAQPCVIADENAHTYCLNPDSPLKAALVSKPAPEQLPREIQKDIQSGLRLNFLFCLNCGNVRKCDPELSLLLKCNGLDRDTRLKVNRFVSLICRRIREGKCGFP